MTDRRTDRREADGQAADRQGAKARADREASPVPAELVDPARLGAWLDGLGLAPGAPLEISRLSGGRSNEMFRVRRGGGDWVLRRPALVAADRADEGLVREHRILAALAGTGVPHPRVAGLCNDPSVLGRTFYLMERVPGEAPMPGAAAVATPEGRRAAGLAMIDALAALHAVDFTAVGLGDLGRPGDFHERQVERWTGQLERDGGPGLPGIGELAEWLRGNRPAQWSPALMHGDYHFGNVLLEPGPPARVTAIVDWETCTIGDPLLDLAGFLRIWCEAGLADDAGRAEMIDRYSSRTGREVPDLTYWTALARFRLAVLLEGIHVRSMRDPQRPTLHDTGVYARRLVRDAVAALPGGPVPAG